MRLPLGIARGVEDGSVTLAFRRWDVVRVKVGSRFLTPVGLIEITSIEPVDGITQEEAEWAGSPSPEALLASTRGDAQLYRVGVVWAGPDPRWALRENADLTDDDLAAIQAKLERLDRASSHGAWTIETLELIEQQPRRRAPDLAEMVGRETEPFKIDVRKLKGMGLTRSFEVGYELSPRGREFLDRVR